MTDIEVKRKELETAKRIREAGGFCGNTKPEVLCIEDSCPCAWKGGCRHWQTPDWDAFISTREAELAEMEKTPTKVCEKCGGAGFYYTKGATTMEAVKRVCECQDHYHAGVTTAPKTLADRIPTLDDFALALIQGGFGITEPGYDYGESFKALFSLAESLKAESDRRRPD